MKIFLTILTICISSILVYGQGNGLYEFLGENGEYGFMDKTGQIKIEAKYIAAKDFSEGLAFVSEETTKNVYKWICIDTLGNKVFGIAGNFPETNFSNGFARIRGFTEHWFVNKEGENEFGKTWEEGYKEYRNGIAYVSDSIYSNFYPIDINGNRVGTKTYSRIEIYNKIHKKKKQEKGELIPFKVDSVFGFKDKNGQIVIKPRFSKVGEFENGICPVQTTFPVIKVVGGYYNAVIDTNGNILNKVEMYCYLGFQGDLIEYYPGVHFTGGPHYLDKKGQKVEPIRNP